MSYYDDFIATHMFDVDDLYYKYEELASCGQWETKDGDRINVEDMTTSHIKNCINFIKRKDKEDFMFPCLDMFEKELKKRGCGAKMKGEEE